MKTLSMEGVPHVDFSLYPYSLVVTYARYQLFIVPLRLSVLFIYMAIYYYSYVSVIYIR